MGMERNGRRSAEKNDFENTDEHEWARIKKQRCEI
jgi:hypothetical protein